MGEFLREESYPILVDRRVYSTEELKEIEKHAPRGGARVLEKKRALDGAGMIVSLEINIAKRQF